MRSDFSNVRQWVVDGFDAESDGGALQIAKLRVIASWGGGWEHVSVSRRDRTPDWGEMCFVKDLFWESHEAVMQLHPPKASYINNHPFCLHLWRPIDAEIPLPSSLLVGLPQLNNTTVSP